MEIMRSMYIYENQCGKCGKQLLISTSASGQQSEPWLNHIISVSLLK